MEPTNPGLRSNASGAIGGADKPHQASEVLSDSPRGHDLDSVRTHSYWSGVFSPVLELVSEAIRFDESLRPVEVSAGERPQLTREQPARDRLSL